MAGYGTRRMILMAAAVLTAIVLATPAAAEAPRPRIVGGTPVTDIDDFPHVAYLEVGFAQCGAFLVTPTWMATAAHCFFDGFGTQIAFADDITAYLNTLKDPFVATPPGTEVRSADFLITHPDYDDFTAENDIALFRITTPSSKTPTGLASHLTASLFEPGDIATVAGWGATSEDDPPSEDLLWVDVPIVSDAACNASLFGIITGPLMICAGDIVNGGVDSCQGDSGGPLSVPDPAGGWITVGIVSFGLGCGQPNSPGVYTEVAAFREWIASVIPGFNVAPIAVDDAVTVDEGDTLFLLDQSVLDNDLDPDNEVLFADALTTPAHGTLDFFDDGSFVYQHDGSETTTDSFTYAASDLEADSGPATVTITINPVNDAPLALNDSATVAEGGRLTVNGVLDNDTDSEGDALTAVQVAGPAHGTLTLAPNGSYVYVHDGSETAVDFFTYVADDGAAQSNVATVTIAVEPVNDAPAAADDGPFLVDNGGTVAIDGVLDNDTDGEGDVLTAVQVAGPAHGTLTLNGDGSFTYRHDGSATTSDAFTYQATDGLAVSNVATVTLRIRPAGAADLAGVVDQDAGLWFLADLSPQGPPLAPFYFGNPRDVPFLGDWDGDGLPTPGLYRPSDGKVYLRNSNTPGIADVEFFFGDPFDVPLIGDWDGDGDDTISLYRPSIARVFVQNDLGAGNRGLGPADFAYTLGDPFDVPFAADFDGDGRDSVGVKRGNVFHWRNALDFGAPDNPAGLRFGDPDDQPLFGDWDGDGVATPGAYRPGGPIFVRDDRRPGAADALIFADGFESGDTAVWSTVP